MGDGRSRHQLRRICVSTALVARGNLHRKGHNRPDVIALLELWMRAAPSGLTGGGNASRRGHWGGSVGMAVVRPFASSCRFVDTLGASCVGRGCVSKGEARNQKVQGNPQRVSLGDILQVYYLYNVCTPILVYLHTSNFLLSTIRYIFVFPGNVTKQIEKIDRDTWRN